MALLLPLLVSACGARTALHEPPPIVADDAASSDVGASLDAGHDGGADAGIDVGTDVGTEAGAGTDAGSDAGLDAASDAGLDAGSDAGLDTGSDAGLDASPCAPAGWGPAVVYAFGPVLSSHATWMATGDFDEDGDVDFAATGAQDDRVAIYLNDGDGTFADGVVFPSGAWSEEMVTADFDRDGHLDLAITNAVPPCGSPCCGSDCHGSVAVLRGHGDGTFAPARTTTSGDLDPYGLAAGDLDADGDVDLVVVNTYPGSLAVLTNPGDGAFVAPVVTPSPGVGTVTLGDLDDDGAPEVIAGAERAGQHFVDTYGVVGGTLVLRASLAYTLSRPSTGSPRMVAADFDGTGRIAVAAMGGYLFDNDGSGTLLAPRSYGLPGGYGRIGAADVDRDGAFDLVQAMQFFGTTFRDSVGYAPNDGHGEFTAPPVLLDELAIVDVVVADLNRDGVLDFVLGNTGWVSVMLSRCE